MPDALIAASRGALAAVLAGSAVLKLVDRAATGDALRAYGLPATLAGPLAWLLPAAEGGVAAMLLVFWPASWPAWLALGMLAAFTFVTSVHLVRGNRPPCPCFGARGARPISGATLVRDALLLALAVIATA